jgi:hypothetical protein
MELPNRRFLSWKISTQVAVGTWLLSALISQYICMYVNWGTGRLSLTELYDNGDLKLVPKKTTKKYMRQLTYREVVLIKF